MKSDTKFSIIIFVLAIVGFIWFSSCTEQQRAKNYGGEMEITLPVNEKLINATWKENDIWYLTRPMNDDEEAEEYKFSQSSAFGIFEGTVVIKEVKSSDIKKE